MFKSLFNNATATLLRLTQPGYLHDFKQFTTRTAPLLFWKSPVLCAEPLKKKKRIDPAVIKAREDRRRRKIEKQIRRLERNAKQLKPIDEIEVPYYLVDNKALHTRERVALTPEILEERALLEKQWTNYKRTQLLKDVQMVDRFSQSQQRALDELKKESEVLYAEAVQVDLTLIPYTSQGPVQTPPINNYDSPDGDYLDISRKW